jgi:hypothetical protein
MSLQLLSTIDSFAGAELHAVALRHAGLPDSFGSIGAEKVAPGVYPCGQTEPP